MMCAPCQDWTLFGRLLGKFRIGKFTKVNHLAIRTGRGTDGISDGSVARSQEVEVSPGRFDETLHRNVHVFNVLLQTSMMLGGYAGHRFYFSGVRFTGRVDQTSAIFVTCHDVVATVNGELGFLALNVATAAARPGIGIGSPAAATSAPRTLSLWGAYK